MKLATTHRGRTTALAVVALVLVIMSGAVQASARQSSRSAQLPQTEQAAKDRSKPRVLYGSTLFATWGTVTNGNSSANAAEHREKLTGGHAGSANAAEAPAFLAYPR